MPTSPQQIRCFFFGLCLVLVCSWPGTSPAAGENEEITLYQIKRDRHPDRSLVYKRVGGRNLRLDLYLPTTPAAEKAPPPVPRRAGMVMFHGGGWTAEGTSHVAPLCRYFARRGMVVANAEYRLASDETGVTIRDCVADARDAFRTLHGMSSRLEIDPARIFLAGESAGGHLAAAVGLIPAHDLGPGAATLRPAGLLLYNPCLDLEALSWTKHHPALLAPTGQETDTESWADRASHWSPASYVAAGAPPTLVLHGEEDDVVPIAQIDAFATAMVDNGNEITLHRFPDWGHAFALPIAGSNEQVITALARTDAWLIQHGVLQGEPAIAPPWSPPAYHARFGTSEDDHAEEDTAHVVGRSHSLAKWPYLDGQWLGITATAEGDVYFSVSTHDRIRHAQVFRYRLETDTVEHLADLGRVCGQSDSTLPTQDKIHSDMFDAGDRVLCGTCEGHATNDPPYPGGYWIAIEKETGAVDNLGKSITNDGILCAGYDPRRNILYGHTNRNGLLSRFDPATGEERILGVPWAGSGADWPRGLTHMVTADGRVYGFRHPHASIWEYDPDTDRIRILDVEMPLPAEVETGDPEALADWQTSAAHITLWNEEDACFYFLRSFDEMLCRFYPPREGSPARIETLDRLRPEGLTSRYGNRLASCTLEIIDRTVWYTPNSGWGGITHLASYDLETRTFRDHGSLIVEDRRYVNECHSMDAGPDGRLYMVAFVFSIEGLDPVRRNAMRDRYPFHPRFVIVDPDDLLQKAAK